MRTEIWNKMGTLSKRIANNGGKGILFTATHDTCNGEKWMWVIQFDCSCGTKEGGYQSETEQEALNKGIEFCKEKGYEFIQLKIMEKRFIYATNRSQVIYKFVIVNETENEYVVNDKDFYPHDNVNFYINKKDLCQARCEDNRWDFIVKEDFYASFDLEDVRKEFNKRQIDIILQSIKEKENKIKELESIIIENKEYNVFKSFDDFNIGDTLYILHTEYGKTNLYKREIVSFVTTDKINFIPNIESIGMEDYVPLRLNQDNELVVDFIEKDYDYCEYETNKVFLTKEDYEIYLQNKENEKNIKMLNNYKQHIIGYKNDLIKLGYGK